MERVELFKKHLSALRESKREFILLYANQIASELQDARKITCSNWNMAGQTLFSVSVKPNAEINLRSLKLV